MEPNESVGTRAIRPGRMHPWRLLSKAVLRRGNAPDWMEEVQASVAELEQMNRSTEKDFLAITDRLAGFLAAARTISSGARALIDAIAGEAGDSACEALIGVLENARAMEKHAGAARQLAQLRDDVAEIRRSLAGFERVGPSFHVMATMAQIETARLGAAGLDLGHLTSGFRSAGESIRSRVEYVLERAALLERRIESALEDTSRLDERSLRALPSLIAIAEGGLKEFRTRQERGGVSASHLARQSETVGKGIADIVASVQFHDITRQQVEHVVDSLSQLGRDPSWHGPSSQPPPRAAAVIELQLAQLANARTQFVDALRQMDRRLDTIAAEIHAMAAESGALVGSCANRDASFYSRMESSFRAIADAAADCKSLDESTGCALVELRRTLESLEESIREIHTVELRLKRLAINAAVSAVHIGAAAEPLEVLAAAMCQLVAECEASSSRADATIGSIVETVRSAIGNAAGADLAAGDAWFDQLGLKIGELHKLNTMAASRSGEIAGVATGLAADVEALRNGLSAERVFTRAAEHCCEILGAIKARAAAVAGPIGEELVQFKQHYTMTAERDVHDAVTASVQQAGGPALAAAPPEFGENVELF